MKNIAPQALIKLVILLGFTLFIAYLSLSGNILLYVTPQLAVDVELAGVGLLLFTGFQLYVVLQLARKKQVVCACGQDGHDHSHEPSRSIWKNIVLYGLFLLPLLLGIAIPDQALAGSMTQNKGINLGLAAVNNPTAPPELVHAGATDDPTVKAMFKTDVYNRDYATLGMRLYKLDTIEMGDVWFIEKLQALNTFAANFQGKQIKITGYVSREEGLGEDEFIVGRLAMTHCIADITPYGIVAESPNASSTHNDSWVTVTGTIGTTTQQGKTVIKINVQDVQPATAPTIPYVYPDWDFASKL